ncbi:MAG: undecaprenyl-diphosphate phosphatase [archaeon]
MVLLIQAVILSIVQGITEWFPVSSSGHLSLFQEFFGFQNLPFDVFLHFASILAVIIIFRKDIINVLNIRKKHSRRYIGYLIIAIIPAIVFALFFRDVIAGMFHNLAFIGIFFIFSGVIIFSTKFSKYKNKKLNWLDGLFIGLFQVFALFPGISRSGMTISSGLFRGLSKEAAIKFSFLLAIPMILAASIAEAPQVFSSDISYTILIVSFIVTFLVSLFVIKLLIRIIKSDNFYWFGVYDIILGVVVLVLSFL